MKPRLFLSLFLILTCISSTLAQTTSFTYHGQLTQAGQPANGSFDFRVILFDALFGGSQVGPINSNLAVNVSQGLFTTQFDFGAGAFNGQARWIDISVRTAGSGDFVQLSPRQAITPAPYAQYAMTPAGPEGPQGPAGPQGIAGPVGPKGVIWRGAWADTTNYSADDAVHFDGAAWISTGRNVGSKPAILNPAWSLLASQGSVGPQGPQGPQGPAGSSDSWSRTGNVGTDPTSNFVGTADSAAFVIRAGNQPVVRYEGQTTGVRIIAGQNSSIDSSTTNAVILGGRDNSIAAAAHESVISGGLDNIIGRDQRSSVIAGGTRNEILQDNQHGVIAGGRDNRIGTNTVISVVGGGAENRIANNVDGGYMAGGFRNDILGSDDPNRREIAPVLIGGSDNEIGRHSSWTVLLGGDNNRIGTNCAATVILGGTNNLVADNSAFSFATGRRTRVNHPGAWMWADSQNASFASAGVDTFNIRSRGGIHVNGDTSMFFGSSVRQMLNLWSDRYGIGVQSSTFYSRTDAAGSFSWFRGGEHSNNANTPGAGGVEMMRLNSGGLRVNGTFVSASDRNKKENFKPIDPTAVLEKVAALPISEWNYKDDPSARHVGPMAQDFQAAFQVGFDDKHIATVDADGVAFAAIQGLNLKLERQAEMTEAKDERIQKLEQEIAQLRSLVEQALTLKNGKQ